MTHPNEVSTMCHLALRTRMGRSWPQQNESVKLWNACSIRSSRSCDEISVDWQTDTHTDTKRGCLCLNSWILGYTPQITVSCWCPSLAHCCRCPSSGEPLVAPRFWSELWWINSLFHTDDFSVPVNDGADPSAPAPSGASSRFRSSIRTRAWWHHQCPISTWSVKLWGWAVVFQLVGEVIVVPLIQSKVGGFLVHHLVHLALHLRIVFVEEEDFLVHHGVNEQQLVRPIGKKLSCGHIRVDIDSESLCIDPSSSGQSWC